MRKFTVDYRTIHGMEVELPDEFNGYVLLSAFAEAYVRYVQSRAMVSNETLVSSIGSDNAKQALLLGIEEKFEPVTAKVFKSIAETDGLWEMSLLQARYGRKKGYAIFLKKFSGYPQTLIDNLLKQQSI